MCIYYKHLVIIVIVHLVKGCISICDDGVFRNIYGAGTYDDKEATYLYDGCVANSHIQRFILLSKIPKVMKGTFRNLPLLREIVFNDVNVQVIEPGFSVVTPKLRIFKAERNQIRVIQNGVFNTLNLSTIDISSNIIARIDDGAFHGMNLEYLCLSNNKLTTINSTWFHNTTITALAITHNQIFSLSTNTFDGLLELLTLKLDFNQIHNIEADTFSRQCCLRNLYLPGNSLGSVNFTITNKLELVDVSLNMIYSIVLQDNTSLKKMSIYPNPWACKCLRKFWKQLHKKDISLEETHSLKVPWKEEYSVCSAFDVECNMENLIVKNFMHINYYKTTNYTNFGKYVYNKEDDFVDLGDYTLWFTLS